MIMPIGSFKLRLAAYFVLLALVPLSAVSWAFGRLVASNETHQTDARLATGVQVVVGEYRREIEELDRTAQSLAGAMAVPDVLRPQARTAIIRSESGLRNTVVYVRGRRMVGSPPAGLAVERSAPIVDDDGRHVG